MRICIVADSASARFGGEALLPFQYFRLLSQRGEDVWLVVHERTRAELEEAFPASRDRILFTADSKLHRSLLSVSNLFPRRVAWATVGQLLLMLTQWQQRQAIRALVRREAIEVVHQPVPVSPRMPSMMFGLGAPVVIGPLNGGMEYPPAFRDQESRLSRIIVKAASSLSTAVNGILPGKLHAAVVLVANERTRQALPRHRAGKLVEMVENAIDLNLWEAKTAPAEHRRSQFVYIGRMPSWKRLDIALRALSKLSEASLLVIGNGGQRDNWEKLCVELNIQGRVSFAGWQSHAYCADALAQSVALVLPSIYESGGAVVLEAMAAGRPVIATRWGGPADYLDADCGILVDPISEEAMVEQFAHAMRKLLLEPALADRMGAAGRRRVEQSFTWDKKIDAMLETYRDAIDASRG